MQTELQKHYQQIQEAIKSNIGTIKVLIEQADTLQKLVESISAADQTQKDKLQNEIISINTSISTLISNTESLFKLYDEFIKALSK